MFDYLKARLKEKDTWTVIGAAAYTVARAFVPPHYVTVVDIVAGALGLGVMATPQRREWSPLERAEKAPL